MRAALDILSQPTNFPQRPCMDTTQNPQHSGLEASTWPASLSLGTSPGPWGSCDILGALEVKYPFPLTFCVFVVDVPEQPFDLSPLLSWRLRHWGCWWSKFFKRYIWREKTIYWSKEQLVKVVAGQGWGQRCSTWIIASSTRHSLGIHHPLRGSFLAISPPDVRIIKYIFLEFLRDSSFAVSFSLLIFLSASRFFTFCFHISSGKSKQCLDLLKDQGTEKELMRLFSPWAGPWGALRNWKLSGLSQTQEQGCFWLWQFSYLHLGRT